MVRERHLHKSSKRKGGYVRHGTLSRNALDYAELESWAEVNDLEMGHNALNELSTIEKSNLARLSFENILELRDADQKEKMEFIKRLPVSLNLKRFIRTKLRVDEDGHTTGYNRWRRRRNATLKIIKRNPVRESLKFLSSNYKTIEAEFGSGVLSYFLFLRWLLGLNFYIFLLLLAFIVIPQTVLHNIDIDNKYIQDLAANATLYNRTSDQGPSSLMISWTNLTTYCSALYKNDVDSSTDTADVFSIIRDFIQGTGWMERTILFYGFYSHKEVSLTPTSFHYSVPLAYLMVVILCFALSLVLMLWRTKKTMHMNNERKRAKKSNETSKIVLCAWDHALTNPNPVRLRHKTLHMEVMAILEEEKLQMQRKMRTRCEWLGISLVRIIINFIILGILAGAAYLIYYATKVSADFSAREDYDEKLQMLQLLMDFLPSLTITVLNFLIPIMFGFIVKAEKYNPTFELNMTLGRTVFLRLASLAILFATLYNELTCSSVDQCRVGILGRCSTIRCWETYTGQQIYRLIVLQIAVEIGSIFFLDFPRRFLVDKLKGSCCTWINHAEFNISKTVLDLIYCQTLFWIGIFFAPLTCVMAVCYFFILFYLKKLTLMMNYKPSQKPYRSSKSHTFLMVVLIIAFVLCCIPVGYSIWALTPSRGCGPFRSQEQVWSILTRTIEDLPLVFQEVFSFLFSLGFAIPLFIIMTITLYWYHAVGRSRNEYINILIHQVEMENRDKKFLVEKLNKIRKRESPEVVQPLNATNPGEHNENYEADDTLNSDSENTEAYATVIKDDAYNGNGFAVHDNEGFT